jgi:hypothetical protein
MIKGRTPRGIFAMAVFCLFSPLLLEAQDGPRTLSFDASHLKLAVALDRKVYLPGEAAEITFEISNLATTPVLALLPFSTATGCVYLSWRGSGGFDPGDGWKVPMETLCQDAPVDKSMLTTFAPGETMRQVLNSYDFLFGTGQRLGLGGGMPGTGKFRLVYHYASIEATAEFEVVTPSLEASAVARIKDVPFRENPNAEQTVLLPEYVYVVALREGNTSFICVSQAEVALSDVRLRNADGSFDLSAVTPFKRIATSAASVTSLSAVADDQENLRIEWKDAEGGRQSVYYEHSYPMRARIRRR